MPELTSSAVAVEICRLGVRLGEPLAVAVSGGADSVALLLLVAEHFDVTALTVDHGLRAAAATEVAQVAALCAARGIKHHTFVWEGEKPSGNIQAEAREARYSIMSIWCAENNVSFLATAHHMDDQAETVMLRLARGSGVYGLAGMAPTRALPLVGEAGEAEVTLIRPLLPFAKAVLVAFLKDRDIPWSEDPSNQSDKFDRVKIRKMLDDPPVEGLHAERLAATAGRLRRTRNALEHYEAKWLRRAVEVFPEGYCILDLKELANEPEEILLRGLASLCRFAGKGVYVPRMEKLLRLFGQLTADGFRGQTLYGAQFTPLSESKILITRELSGCKGESSLAKTTSWDNRFEISAKGDIAGLEIRALGEEGWRQLKASGFDVAEMQLPRLVALVLPAIFKGPDLQAVPHLGYEVGNSLLVKTRPIRTIITKI